MCGQDRGLRSERTVGTPNPPFPEGASGRGFDHLCHSLSALLNRVGGMKCRFGAQQKSPSMHFHNLEPQQVTILKEKFLNHNIKISNDQRITLIIL